MELTPDDERLLRRLWYDPEKGFARARVLYYTAKPRATGRFTMQMVEDWVQKQETYQLQKPTRTPREIGAILSGAPRQIIQIDLIDMSAYRSPQNRGTTFVLVGYDTFSKMLYAVPMRNKSEASTIEALADMIDQMGNRPPKILMSDNGLEFNNEGMRTFCSDLRIKQLFSRPGNPRTNGYVERANGTLKRVIFKYMQANDTNTYVPALEKIVDRINRTPHRVTKLPPVEVDILPRGDPLLNDVKERIRAAAAKRGTPIPEAVFEVGDEVRFALAKGVLEKGGPNWSDYTLPVKALVYPRNPYTPIRYRLENDQVYYAEELQLTRDIMESPARKAQRQQRRDREQARAAGPRPVQAPVPPREPRPAREIRPVPGRPNLQEMIQAERQVRAEPRRRRRGRRGADEEDGDEEN